MQSNRSRRVQRIRLAQPLAARLGATPVVLVDLSTLGARVEHTSPMQAGGEDHLAFRWEEVEIAIECRIVRSRLDRFSGGADGLTVYHSGLEFEEMKPEVNLHLKNMIGGFITRAIEEQKLNARGVLPAHDVNKMPIFRFDGQLSADRGEVAAGAGSALIPTTRIAREIGYVTYHLEGQTWRKKRTQDPGQPMEGFTVSAAEDHEQVALLRDAYLNSDQNGRKMIQLLAQMSIMEGEGGQAGRFKP